MTNEAVALAPQPVDIKPISVDTPTPIIVDHRQFATPAQYPDVAEPEVIDPKQHEQIGRLLSAQESSDFQTQDMVQLLDEAITRGVNVRNLDLNPKSLEALAVLEKNRGENGKELATQVLAALTDKQVDITKEHHVEDARITRDQAGKAYLEGTSGLDRIRTELADAWDTVFPALMALDSGMALITGHHPTLPLLMRQAYEMQGYKPTNEGILFSLDVPPVTLELLKEKHIGEKFFSYFKKNKEKLLSFLHEITPTSNNMFLLLEKLETEDIKFLVEHRQFPGEIDVTEEQLKEYLSKLRPYEREKLGIHPTELRMIN